MPAPTDSRPRRQCGRIEDTRLAPFSRRRSNSAGSQASAEERTRAIRRTTGEDPRHRRGSSAFPVRSGGRAGLGRSPDHPGSARPRLIADIARSGHGREVARATGQVRGVRQVRDRFGLVPATGLRSRGAAPTRHAEDNLRGPNRTARPQAPALQAPCSATSADGHSGHDALRSAPARRTTRSRPDDHRDRRSIAVHGR